MMHIKLLHLITTLDTGGTEIQGVGGMKKILTKQYHFDIFYRQQLIGHVKIDAHDHKEAWSLALETVTGTLELVDTTEAEG